MQALTSGKKVWGRAALAATALLLLLLMLAPVRAHDPSAGGEMAASASGAVVVPETRFELKIVDTSNNDPLLGGEAPLENAQVKATLSHKGEVTLNEIAPPEQEKQGVYEVQGDVDENGAHVLRWNIVPKTDAPFSAEFPIQVSGAPEQNGAAFFSGWRIPAVIAGGILLFSGVFAMGRRSGESGHGVARDAVSLVLVAILVAGPIPGVWAHDGETHGAEGAAAPGQVANLKVGIGDTTTAQQTKTVGKYRVTLTVKVMKPAPPDPNHVRLTAEQIRTIGLQTEAAGGGRFATGLSVTGSIQPNPASVVTINSRLAGRLRRVSVTVGDRVRAGQTLAVIEAPDITVAQGALSEAQGQVSVREAAISQAEERARIAERQLSGQQQLARAGAFSQPGLQQAQTELAQVNSDLATVRGEVAGAESERAQAQADAAAHAKSLQRIQELFDAGIRSRAELEAQQLEVTQDKARVQQAEEMVIQQRNRVAQAQARVSIVSQAVRREQRIAGGGVLTRREIVQAQGVLDTARLAVAEERANLQAARRGVGAARSRLASLGGAPGGDNTVSVVAPLDAIVTAREAAIGETVSPDKTLFTLLNPSIVVVEGDVFEQDLPQVRVGLPARISTDAIPGKTFEGRISDISANVDPETRTARARIVISNPGGALRPGAFVRALLVTKARPRTVTVPDAALQDDAGMKVVYVKKGDQFERREVSVGESAGGRTEIRRGVAPGEQVVTTGAYQLRAISQKS